METCHNQENITLDKISINEEDNDNLDEGEILSDDEHINVLSSDIHINDHEELETDVVNNDEVKDLEEGELEEDGAGENEKIKAETKSVASKGTGGVHSRVQCKFFSRGNCSWGSNCRFLHSSKTLTSSDPTTNAAPTIYPLMSLCSDLSPLDDNQLFEGAGSNLSLLSKAGASKLSHLSGSKPEDSKPLPLMKSLLNGSIEPLEATAGVTSNGRDPVGGEAASSPLTEGTATAPPPESAWERGLRQAKELMKRSAEIKSNQLIEPPIKPGTLTTLNQLIDLPAHEDLTIVVGDEWGGRERRFAPYPPGRDLSPLREPRPFYWPEGYEPAPPSRKRYYQGAEDYYPPPPPGVGGRYEGRYHAPPPHHHPHPYEDYYYPREREDYDPYGPPPRRARPLHPHPHDSWGPPPEGVPEGYYHPYPPPPRRSHHYYYYGAAERDSYYYRHPQGPPLSEHSRYPHPESYKGGTDRTPRAYKRLPPSHHVPGGAPHDPRSSPSETQGRDPQGKGPPRREGGAMSSHDDVSSVGSIEPAPASPLSNRGRGRAPLQASDSHPCGTVTPEWHDPWARKSNRREVTSGGRHGEDSQGRKDVGSERGIGVAPNLGIADQMIPDFGTRIVRSGSSRSSSSRSRSSSSSSSSSSRSGARFEPTIVSKPSEAAVRSIVLPSTVAGKRPRPDALPLGVEVSSGEEAALLAEEFSAPSVKKRSHPAALKFERTSSFSSISSFSSPEEGVESISDVASCPASPSVPVSKTTTATNDLKARATAVAMEQKNGRSNSAMGARGRSEIPPLAQQIKMKLVNKPKNVQLTENLNKEAFSPLSSDGSDIGDSNCDHKVTGSLNDCLAQSLARKPVASQRYDKLSTVYPLPTPTSVQRQASIEKVADSKVPISSNAAGNSSASSRREQLLKQLRAVEEAIARKRTK